MVHSQRSQRAFVALSTATWLRHGRRGIILARSHSLRAALVQAVLSEGDVQPVRVLVPTRVLVDVWERDLSPAVQVHTYAEAMRFARRVDPGLLVFDQVQAVGAALIEYLCTARDGVRVLGLAAGPLSDRFLWDVAAYAGPVLVQEELSASGESARVVLELDLSPGERFAYEAARDRFIAVYDRWRGAVGLSDWSRYVVWARESLQGRRSLRAWHESRRILAWTEAKAQVLGEILSRHKGQRILILTADKASSYAISRKHLVMPLTGDLTMTERRRAIADFGRGSLKVLVAPRLLDDLELADVEVVVDIARRRNAQRQVPRAAVQYELCTRRTAEHVRQPE